MNDLQIFNHSQFGEVRWVEIDGKPGAVGIDIAKALGYAKPSQAVIDHCKGIRKLGIPSEGGTQETNVIFEGDIYRLIVKAADQSKNEEIKAKAEVFEKWVFDDVIPTIRKTGSYLPKKETRSLATWEKAAIGEIRFAKEFAKAAGIRTERALAVALSRVERQCGTVLTDYKRMLPPVEEEKAELYTPSDIGKNFDLKANQINLILETIGLQYGMRVAGKKEGTQKLAKRNPWNLTDKGKEYGIMQDAAKQSSGGKWEGFQILWNSKAIEVVKEHLQQKAVKELQEQT